MILLVVIGIGLVILNHRKSVNDQATIHGANSNDGVLQADSEESIGGSNSSTTVQIIDSKTSPTK